MLRIGSKGARVQGPGMSRRGSIYRARPLNFDAVGARFIAPVRDSIAPVIKFTTDVAIPDVPDLLRIVTATISTATGVLRRVALDNLRPAAIGISKSDVIFCVTTCLNTGAMNCAPTFYVSP